MLGSSSASFLTPHAFVVKLGSQFHIFLGKDKSKEFEKEKVAGMRKEEVKESTPTKEEKPEKDIERRSAGSASGGRGGSTSAEKMSAHLRSLIANGGKHAPVVKDISKVFCENHLNEMLGQFMLASTIEEMMKRVETYKCGCASTKELTEGLRVASSSLKGHILTRQREAERKKKNDLKAAEPSQVQKTKRQTKELAAQLKSANLQKPSLFCIDWPAVIDEEGMAVWSRVSEVNGPSKGSIGGLKHPVLITGSSAIEKCLRAPQSHHLSSTMPRHSGVLNLFWRTRSKRLSFFWVSLRQAGDLGFIRTCIHKRRLTIKDGRNMVPHL